MIDLFGTHARADLAIVKLELQKAKEACRMREKEIHTILTAQDTVINSLTTLAVEKDTKIKEKDKYIEKLEQAIRASDEARKSLGEKNRKLVGENHALGARVSELRVKYEREREANETDGHPV